MIRLKLYVLAVTVFCTLGCNSQDKIDTLELPILNPTSHIFNLPIQILKDTLINIFSFNQQDSDKSMKNIFSGHPFKGYSHYTQQTFLAESAKDSILHDYFRIPGREDDIYLFALTGAWDSKLYYANNKPMLFESSYILHLKKISDNQTQIKIEGDNSFVINGMDGYGAHGPKRRQQKISPTTIEEYTLILFIASKLRDNSLPPLKLPRK
jgi:hypothetical protein